jgi:RND family efflux transporter MFP subunit
MTRGGSGPRGVGSGLRLGGCPRLARRIGVAPRLALALRLGVALGGVIFGVALGGVSLGGCRDAGDTGDLGEPLEVLAPPGPADDPGDEKPGFIAALTPEHSADIMAPYTSASASLAVKLGDVVKKGQLLARLDDRQLRQELDAARAQAHTAEATITQAEVDKRGAEIVLAREHKAEAEGVGSKADVAGAEQAVAKASAMITVAHATAEERATQIARLQAHLQEMTLVAPIDGRVAMIYPQDGARVEEGHAVLRVISGGVFVKFAIPADKIGAIHAGDTVDVRLDRRPEPLAATVRHIAPELDAVAQMILADAELINPPPDLQPGTVGRIVPRLVPRLVPRPHAQPAPRSP